MAPRGTSRRWGSPVYPWHGGFSVLARAGPGAAVPEAGSTAGPCTGGACSRPGLCGRRPHPSVPVPEAVVVLGSRRVTQLLEHLSEAVEQSSLFDPQHPGLEEELESLRRRLEALSSSEPSSMETHFRNPAGRLCPACPPAACAGRAGAAHLPSTRWCDGTWQCLAAGPHHCVPGRASCDASLRGAVPCATFWRAALNPCLALARIRLHIGVGSQGPGRAAALPDAEPVPAQQHSRAAPGLQHRPA